MGYAGSALKFWVLDELVHRLLRFDWEDYDVHPPRLRFSFFDLTIGGATSDFDRLTCPGQGINDLVHIRNFSD